MLNHDEGYETNKELLPLTAIAMGDTDASNEYAYHTIGSLQCSGRLDLILYIKQ